MPSKLSDSFHKKEYNANALAGAYAHKRMENFVDDINAASYPHMPKQNGGKVYRLCDQHLINCMKLIGNEDPSNLSPEIKDSLRDDAINALNNLVETLSSDDTLEPAEQRYLDQFVFFQAVTEKILTGENMDSIRHFIKTAPIGENTPPEPQ